MGVHRCARTRAGVWTCVRACVRVCMRACARARVGYIVRMRLGVHASAGICMYACRCVDIRRREKLELKHLSSKISNRTNFSSMSVSNRIIPPSEAIIMFNSSKLPVPVNDFYIVSAL